MWIGLEWCLESDVVLEWLPAGWRGRESGVPLWIYMSGLATPGQAKISYYDVPVCKSGARRTDNGFLEFRRRSPH